MLEPSAVAFNPVMTPLAIVLFFTMVTTLRFSIEGTLKTGNALLRVLTHPAWLTPLILEGGFTLGLFYHGKLSPWPPATFRMLVEKYGFWGGIAGAEAAITVDIFLLWATATTFKVFSPPHDARVVKYYYAVNLIIGAYLMARFAHVIDMGAAGILPG